MSRENPRAENPRAMTRRDALRVLGLTAAAAGLHAGRT